MTAPYTQQNYADWKRRFPGGSAVAGLLGQAKQAAGIEDAPEQAPPLLAPTPPFNPNAEQARLGRVDGIHQWTQAEMEQAPQDPADLHEHKRGLLGGLRHLVGADRTAPEVAALLTPDQQKRARPGLLSTVFNAVVAGKGPQTVQQERARQMLDLGDEKKARDAAERQQRIEQGIQVAASRMEPQAAAEFTARMRLTYGLPNAAPMAQATDQMRDPAPPAPRPQMQVPRGAAVQNPDGTWFIPAPIPDSENATKPVLTTGEYLGGTARFKDGVFDTWVLPPKDEPARVQAEREKRENMGRVLGDDLAGVDDAIAQVDQNPSAFGLKNVLPTVMRQRLPGRDADADATTLGSLEYVVGRLRHDRFGGALSALEASKAARIFSEPSSPAEVVRAQLKVVRDALARQQRSLVRQNEATAPSPAQSPEKTFTDPVTGKTYRIP
jgi:hypothetical protein